MVGTNGCVGATVVEVRPTGVAPAANEVTDAGVAEVGARGTRGGAGVICGTIPGNGTPPAANEIYFIRDRFFRKPGRLCHTL